MGKVRKRMAEQLELRNYSKCTKDSYLKRARAFVKFFMRPNRAPRNAGSQRLSARPKEKGAAQHGTRLSVTL